MKTVVSVAGFVLQHESNFDNAPSIIIESSERLNFSQNKEFGYLTSFLKRLTKYKKAIKEMHLNLADLRQSEGDYSMRSATESLHSNAITGLFNGLPSENGLGGLKACPNLKVFGVEMFAKDFGILNYERQQAVMTGLQAMNEKGVAIHLKLKDFGTMSEEFTNFLLALSNVKKLDLSGSDFSQWPVARLRNLFEKIATSGIEELNLNRCGLHSLSAELRVELFGKLKRNGNLQVLHLQGNQLNEMDLTEIEQLFKGFQAIRTVHLVESVSGSSAAKLRTQYQQLAFFETMERAHVTFVPYQDDNLENQEAVRVGLRNLPNLKTLSIKLLLQWVHSQDLIEFFRRLSIALPNLTDIDLSDNHLYDCDITVARAICVGLGNFRKLSHVNLGNNGFNYLYQDCSQAFIDGLHANCLKLETIDLRGNHSFALNASGFEKVLAFRLESTDENSGICKRVMRLQADENFWLYNPSVKQVRSDISKKLSKVLKELNEGVAVVRRCLELQENQSSSSSSSSTARTNSSSSSNLRINLSDDSIVKMATDKVMFFNGAAVAYPFKRDHIIGMLSQIRSRERNRN